MSSTSKISTHHHWLVENNIKFHHLHVLTFAAVCKMYVRYSEMCVCFYQADWRFFTRQASFHHKHALATTGNIGTNGLTQRESSMLIRQNSHTQNALTSLKIYRIRVYRRELRMCDKGGIFHALAHLS